MDKIIIRSAHFMCNIGVTLKERKVKQEIIVDVELFLPKKIAKRFFLADTVNYSEVHNSIKKIVEGKQYKIIESMAEDVAKKILDNFDIIVVIVKIKKPNALANRNIKYVAVEIVREK